MYCVSLEVLPQGFDWGEAGFPSSCLCACTGSIKWSWRTFSYSRATTFECSQCDTDRKYSTLCRLTYGWLPYFFFHVYGPCLLRYSESFMLHNIIMLLDMCDSCCFNELRGHFISRRFSISYAHRPLIIEASQSLHCFCFALQSNYGPSLMQATTCRPGAHV